MDSSQLPDNSPPSTQSGPPRWLSILLWIILGVPILFFVCLGLLLLSSQLVVNLTGRSVTATVIAQSTPPDAHSPQLNQVTDSHGYSVTVWRIDDPAKPTKLYAPRDGVRLVAVDVTVSNGSSGALFVDALRFQLVDASGEIYNESLSSAAGELTSTHLNPGESRTGLVGFVLPLNAKVATLRFWLKDVYLNAGPFISIDLAP